MLLYATGEGEHNRVAHLEGNILVAGVDGDFDEYEEGVIRPQFHIVPGSAVFTIEVDAEGGGFATRQTDVG